jgi:16S rRNA (adenine1518-N6/adenine1519-N6)-dimethyltransferase
MKIKPKKSLGQNFLTDEGVIQEIIQGSNLQKEDVVLEIGPGKGVLTQALAARCRKVLAVELDQSLVPVLENRFKENKNIEIIQGDILKADIKKIIASCELPVTDYRVIANIPYYITSLIIRKFLEAEAPPQEMILMVQKEVAERIVARAGKMSILAVSVQYYADAEILFLVPRTAFDPVPEVDSAVIRITYNAKRIASADAANFFRVVRAGFCAKRKTLANNLANSLHLERKEAEAKLAQAGLASNVRAQELSVEDWKKLAATLL